ncbi:MAG: SDR family oxidoreductase [Allosphingosinicella sp.]|uniref:SDR family oxidoreductase n=1 Tax=Allosphingosinicella sp. TaxID=2823234 RepID=UPI003929E9F8
MPSEDDAAHALGGRVAVVTGASSGIGAAIARDLAPLGVKLVLTARRGERLDALAAELGGEAATLAADVAAPDTASRLLELALDRFGAADILVNNAGVFRSGSLDSFDLDQLASMTTLNFDAVVRSCYVFARAMKAAGRGAIVNVSSIGAHLTAPGSGVYGGLKRGMETFTEALRIELADTGVRVGLVAPGSTETEIFDHIPAPNRPGAAQPIPMLQPRDVAEAVRYLLVQPARANVARVHIYSSGQRH